MKNQNKFFVKEGLLNNKDFLVVQNEEIITINRIISFSKFKSKYFICTMIDNTSYEPMIFLCDKVVYNLDTKQIHILNTERKDNPNIGIYKLNNNEIISAYSNGDEGIFIILDNMEEN